jgi:hypothetical protein
MGITQKYMVALPNAHKGRFAFRSPLARALGERAILPGGKTVAELRIDSLLALPIPAQLRDGAAENCRILT